MASTVLRLASAATVLAAVVALPASAAPVTAPVLTATPITWNILGLDSNRPATDGPDTFPVGARICNTGTADATAVTSSFVFDSTDAAINLTGPGSLSLGDLPAGGCADAYYNVVVTRSSTSFGKARAYRITASASGTTQVETPSGRELYVERLVSQARNEVKGISGSAVQVRPTATTPGRATVLVGQTYTFTVESATAPGGYEQLESFLNFPTTIFQILSVNASYASPTGATNDKIYADACGWDNTPSTLRTSTYRSCVGPFQFTGGKVGGDPILTTYTVKVIAAGTGALGTLIYDFSGSSFHYNADFGTGITAVDFTAVDPSSPADLALKKTHGGTFTLGTNGTYDLSVSNIGGAATAGTTTVTDVLPAGLTYVSATGTGWSCAHASGTVTCTTSDPITGGAAAPSITLTVLPTAGGTVTNTASVDNAGDANTANNSSSDPTLVDRLPSADAESATTDEDTPVAVVVLIGDDLGDSPTTITSNTQGARGSVTCTTTCTYAPTANTNGTDTFTYTITDADGDTSTATVTVTVTPVNDPPVARNNSATSTGGAVLIEVLVDDSDPESDTLTITTPSPTAARGTVACTATTCTYTPLADHSGTDTFTYAVSDGHGGTDTAVVTVSTTRPVSLPEQPAPTTPTTLAPTTTTPGAPGPTLIPAPTTTPITSNATPDLAAAAAPAPAASEAPALTASPAGSPSAPSAASTPATLGAGLQRPADAMLPRTGASSATLALAGAGLLAGGSVLLAGGRRRRNGAAS